MRCLYGDDEPPARKRLQALLDGVRWIETEEDLVFAHTNEARCRTNFTLDELEGHLPPDRFVCTRRSIIVNLDAVHEMVLRPSGPYRLRLTDGTTLSMAHRRTDDVREALGQ